MLQPVWSLAVTAAVLENFASYTFFELIVLWFDFATVGASDICGVSVGRHTTWSMQVIGDRYSPIMLKVEDGLSCTNERKMFRSWKFSTEESLLIYFILAPSVSAAAVHAHLVHINHQNLKSFSSERLRSLHRQRHRCKLGHICSFSWPQLLSLEPYLYVCAWIYNL